MLNACFHCTVSLPIHSPRSSTLTSHKRMPPLPRQTLFLLLYIRNPISNISLPIQATTQTYKPFNSNKTNMSGWMPSSWDRSWSWSNFSFPPHQRNLPHWDNSRTRDGQYFLPSAFGGLGLARGGPGRGPSGGPRDHDAMLRDHMGIWRGRQGYPHR